VRRRLLILLLFGLVLAGGATVTWQAMGKAKLVEEDLTTARVLLANAGGFESGELKRRLRLVKQAEQHTLNARQRLDRWPLRQLGALPLVGRDIRVARDVAASATGTVRATRRVVTALQPIETGPPTRNSILRASKALLGLHTRLKRDLDQVRAARPLLTAGIRNRYLETATSASATAERAGQGLKLAADLYGPSGTTRWFLAFQNPAELRGTGGLIGEYGILESSPTGPELVKIDHYDGLNERTNEGVRLPKQVTARYERFAIGRDWTAVNIPPDMPTVGRIITELYEQTTGDRIDGVIAADPLAVAGILRVAGPIQAAGVWLDADSVAEETLVRAYVRYDGDNDARRGFQREVAAASFEAFRRGLESEPVELIRNLSVAARGRHVQAYVADPAGQRAVAGLGLSGTAAAPASGDYLMPVGVNTGANKLDAFMRRSVNWRVQLSPDGAAQATAAFTLANDSPAYGAAPLHHRPLRQPVPPGRKRAVRHPVRGRGLWLHPRHPRRPRGRCRGPGRLRRPRAHPRGRRAGPLGSHARLPADPTGRGRTTRQQPPPLPAAATPAGDRPSRPGQDRGGSTQGLALHRASPRGPRDRAQGELGRSVRPRARAGVRTGPWMTSPSSATGLR
jgi:hypothetical protein